MIRVTISGPQGSGKTSLIDLLSTALDAAGSDWPYAIFHSDGTLWTSKAGVARVLFEEQQMYSLDEGAE